MTNQPPAASGLETDNRTAFRFPASAAEMSFTGERYVPGLIGDIQNEHYHRYLLALRYCVGKDVLDIACGEGYGSYLLGQVARSVIGVDIDKPTVAHANAAYLSDRVSFKIGSATQMPIKDASVDVVVSFETLEHFAEHEAFRAEVKRVLRPDGLLIISSPNRPVYSEESGQKNEFHVRELNRDEFVRFLREGFAHAHLLEQRSLWGSVLLASDGGSGVEGFETTDGALFERTDGLPHASYFLAIASDVPLPPVAHSVLNSPLYRWKLEEEKARTERILEEERVAHNRELEAEFSTFQAKLEEERQDLAARSSKLEQALARQTEQLRSEQARRFEQEKQHHELARALREQEAAAQISREREIVASEALVSVERVRTLLEAELITLKTTAPWRIARALSELREGLSRFSRIFLSARARKQLKRKRKLREIKIISRSPLFDPKWYLQQYPDVVNFHDGPVAHYVHFGAAEGRDPSPHFSTSAYLRQYPKLRRRGYNPLVHFIERGGSFVSSTAQAAQPLQEAACIADLASAPAAEFRADGRSEWEEFSLLKERIQRVEAERLAAIPFENLPIIELGTSDLATAADHLRFEKHDEVEISIIIPVYNNIRLTLECLKSISEFTSSTVKYEIIVADDASTDETAELLSRIANIVHIRNPQNLNFLLNCNNAAKHARGRYIVLLNNDAQVTRGWIEALLAPFRLYPDTGAVGPRIVYPHGRLQEAGVAINRDGSSQLIGLADDASLPRFNFLREVDYCSGACLIVETEIFRKLGGFWKELAPAYCEDVDLCFRIRQLGLRIFYNPDAIIIHHLSKSTNSLGSDFKMRAIATNQKRISDRWQAEIDSLNDIKILAFYLPQFHPFPENDKWWGKGFTEWRNVTKAKPNFVGHYQPRRPADLGYYDLRIPEVMQQQADLARKYGVHGFCYYYYWFHGQRLLERPIEQMLESGKPDIPFCLCWANENWTRRWDGRDQEVLIAQEHSDEDDIAVIHDLMRYFRSPNYIRINGKPLLLIYRVTLFPDFRRTSELWREICRREGIGEIYLAMVGSFEDKGAAIPHKFGCDALVEFPPHGGATPCTPEGAIINPEFKGQTYDYRAYVEWSVSRPIPPFPYFRSAMPSWDNTARRQNNGHIFVNSSPGGFQAWLERICQLTHEHNSPSERFVFINAWNEWAEGAYLEPDSRYGHSYLEAVRNARDAWMRK